MGGAGGIDNSRSRCAVCSCEPGFVCLRCIGTPFDDSYDEGRQVTEPEFASMTSEPYLYLPPEPFNGRESEQ